MSDAKWCRHLVETLQFFQQQDYLCDMDIVAGDGTVFTAHSCVMAAASSGSSAAIKMCKSKPRLHDERPRLNTTISSEILTGVIQIVYTGKFKVDAFQLEALQHALAELGVENPANQTFSAGGTALPTNPCFEASSGADSTRQNMGEGVKEAEDCCMPNASTVKLEPPVGGYYGPYLAEVAVNNHTRIADDPTSGGTDPHSTESASLDASFQSESEVHDCDRCGKQFMSAAIYQKHVQEKHSKVRSSCCPVCNRAFTGQFDLRIHLRKVHRLLLKESEQLIQAQTGDFVLGGSSIEVQQLDAVESEPDPCVQETHAGEGQSFPESVAIKIEASESEIPVDNPVCNTKVKRHIDLKSNLRSEHGLSLRASNKLLKLTPRVFQCKLCPKTFRLKKTLKRHQGVHSNIRPYVCESCGTRFICRSSLITHIKRNTVPSGESTENAKQSGDQLVLACNKTKQVPSVVRNKDGLYGCDKCDKQFKSKAGYERHAEAGHTDARPHPCPVCGAGFKAKIDVRMHLRYTHKLVTKGGEIVDLNETYQCELCPKSFNRKLTLQKHQVVHSKVKPFSCDQCGMSFKEDSALRAHIKRNTVPKVQTQVFDSSSETTKQSESGEVVLTCKPKTRPTIRRNNDGLYECDQCDKQFRSKSGYDRHAEAGHTDARPYPCPVCGSGFKGKFDVSIHLRYTHRVVSKGGKLVQLRDSYQCELCPKTFKRHAYLKNHQLVHSNARPFSCDLCGKSFKSNCVLQNHVNAMHSSKPKAAPPPIRYWCSQCSKGYRYKGALEEHGRSHSGERPYACRQCGKTFGTNSNRRAHEETHRDTTEYQCPTCGKSFKRRIALYAHERVHNDARPHPCDICGKGFKTRFHRDRHLETVHKATACTTATGGVADEWPLGDSPPEHIMSD